MSDSRGPSDPAIDAALASIAPTGVTTGSRLIVDTDLASLLPVEWAAVSNAVPVRQQEFATGRALLRTLIGTDEAIPVGPDRAPVLPPGVAGSLAHDRQCAVAAVTRRAGISLGIDVEPIEPLSDELAAIVLRPDEDLDAHLAFTLKEAAYKAWSRAGGGMLDHHDVRVTTAESSFTATIVVADVHIMGTYARASRKWVALAVVDGRLPI